MITQSPKSLLISANVLFLLAIATVVFAAANAVATECAGAASGTCTAGDITTVPNGLTVNDDGGDSDSTIEGDTDTSLFYVDAGNDRVGVSTSTPSSLFDVAGNMAITNSGTFTTSNGGTIGGSFGGTPTWTAEHLFDGGLKFNDNDTATFGSGGDATIAYDGGDLRILPSVFGSGEVRLDGDRVTLTLQDRDSGGKNWSFVPAQNAFSFQNVTNGETAFNISVTADTLSMVSYYFLRKTTAGITASTTQTQGQGALTSDINEVSTVANPNDTVTLPTAIAGMKVTVINNGANTLQIFPASGDDLGSGVDTATTLASGSNVTFVAYDATNWEIV